MKLTVINKTQKQLVHGSCRASAPFLLSFLANQPRPAAAAAAALPLVPTSTCSLRANVAARTQRRRLRASGSMGMGYTRQYDALVASPSLVPSLLAVCDA